MKLTESEARVKQCCNLVGSYNVRLNCLASGCMAWRWNNIQHRIDVAPCTYKWEDLPKEQWTGYCGLAGKP